MAIESRYISPFIPDFDISDHPYSQWNIRIALDIANRDCVRQYGKTFCELMAEAIVEKINPKSFTKTS